MKVYELLYDYENNKNSFIFNIDEEQISFNRYDLKRCKFIENWSNIICYYDNYVNDITDYIANNLIILTISERFRKLLEEFNLGNVQFLPIILKRKDNGKE